MCSGDRNNNLRASLVWQNLNFKGDDYQTNQSRNIKHQNMFYTVDLNPAEKVWLQSEGYSEESKI